MIWFLSVGEDDCVVMDMVALGVGVGWCARLDVNRIRIVWDVRISNQQPQH